MKIIRKTIQTIGISALLLLAAAAAAGQQSEQATSAAWVAGETPHQVQLKLVDGNSIAADEAWESEQGIWYRRGGMSHLISRDRVKTVERGATAKPKLERQVAKVVVSDDTSNRSEVSQASEDRPVWIYLVGGARVEADSATESPTGAWYRRGSLSVFVERARIDHIEREELESVAESDSTSKKERGWTTGSSRIDSLIKQSGAKYGVDPYLTFA